MVQGGTMFLSAPLVGRLQMKFDRGLVIAIGLALIAAGTFLNAGLTADWGLCAVRVAAGTARRRIRLQLHPAHRPGAGYAARVEVHNASGLFNVTRNLAAAALAWR